jgi:hypothetical protein
MSLQLEVGKKYVNRKGEIVGPLKKSWGVVYPFICGDRSYTKTGMLWHDMDISDQDLISEYIEQKENNMLTGKLEDVLASVDSMTSLCSNGKKEVRSLIRKMYGVKEKALTFHSPSTKRLLAEAVMGVGNRYVARIITDGLVNQESMLGMSKWLESLNE